MAKEVENLLLFIKKEKKEQRPLAIKYHNQWYYDGKSNWYLIYVNNTSWKWLNTNASITKVFAYLSLKMQEEGEEVLEGDLSQIKCEIYLR